MGIWKSPSGWSDDRGFAGTGEHWFTFRGELILRERVLLQDGRGPSAPPSLPHPESPGVTHVHSSLHPQDCSVPLKASLPLGQRVQSEMPFPPTFQTRQPLRLLLVLFRREYGKLRTPPRHLWSTALGDLGGPMASPCSAGGLDAT